MGHFDAQQVCLNGHQTTDSYYRSSQFRRNHCSQCGAKTIHQCPHCSADIPGEYFTPEVLVLGGGSAAIPKFCEECGDQFPWADKVLPEAGGVTQLEPVVSVERICGRIALVVRQLRQRHGGRTPLDVDDEYDLQDLLHGLLHLFFDDVRAEEYTPSYAGKATRMDFLLKNGSIVIEAKMTRQGLAAKAVGEELIVDIAHYQAHPSCKTLFCLVYDPGYRIANPRGLEGDLSRNHDGLDVRVFVVPK